MSQTYVSLTQTREETRDVSSVRLRSPSVPDYFQDSEDATYRRGGRSGGPARLDETFTLNL